MTMPYSNGNSFNGSSACSDGQSAVITAGLEPWFTSGLLRSNQDRGDV